MWLQTASFALNFLLTRFTETLAWNMRLPLVWTCVESRLRSPSGAELEPGSRAARRTGTGSWSTSPVSKQNLLFKQRQTSAVGLYFNKVTLLILRCLIPPLSVAHGCIIETLISGESLSNQDKIFDNHKMLKNQTKLHLNSGFFWEEKSDYVLRSLVQFLFWCVSFSANYQRFLDYWVAFKNLEKMFSSWQKKSFVRWQCVCL